MGDCRLRIRLADETFLLASNNKDNKASSSTNSSSTITLQLSSDSTVADVLASICHGGKSLRDWLGPADSAMKLWDCTAYPPQDIRQRVLSFSESSGPRSLTLLDAGWFPSGTLVVSPSPPTVMAAHYDDVQYNAPRSTRGDEAGTATPSTAVQLRQHPNHRVAPSQVLQSVTTRFAAEDEARAILEDQAHAVRRQTAASRLAKEEARRARLDRQLRRLDGLLDSGNGKSKVNKVTDQVHRMLLKSRATGRPKLAEEDRVYLRCCFLLLLPRGDKGDDETDEDAGSMTEEIRYVSRQDVVGQVVSSFVSQHTNVRPTPPGGQAEFLVPVRASPSLNDDGHSYYDYRRLSNIMRIYEAVDAGHLKNFDRVVIRWYDPATEDPTTQVNEDKLVGGDELTSAMPSTETTADAVMEEANVTFNTNEVTTLGVNQEQTDPLVAKIWTDEALSAALAAWDKKSKRKAAKSAAAIKVRQMKMKSKATGDTKRVKMADRFFLDVLTVFRPMDKSSPPVVEKGGPFFLAPADPLERLVRDGSIQQASTSSGSSVTTFVVVSDDGFRRLPDATQSLRQLSTDGLLSSFDRVVVMQSNT
jgi:hypothetical protein